MIEREYEVGMAFLKHKRTYSMCGVNRKDVNVGSTFLDAGRGDVGDGCGEGIEQHERRQ